MTHQQSTIDEGVPFVVRQGSITRLKVGAELIADHSTSPWKRRIVEECSEELRAMQRIGEITPRERDEIIAILRSGSQTGADT